MERLPAYWEEVFSPACLLKEPLFLRTFFQKSHTIESAQPTDSHWYYTTSLPYSFNGKAPHKGNRAPMNQIRYSEEGDWESGFHYYGARYYWSEVMTGWLSVDPLADKYPSISPYAYCAWNPIKLVDPDGRIIDTVSLNQEIKDMINPNHETYNEHFHTLYDKLNEDDRAVYSFIKLNSPKKRYDGVEMYGELRCAGRDEQDRDRIIIDYCSSPRYRDRYLLEETYHACQYRYGQIGFEFIGGLWKGICNDLWDEANAQLFAIKHTKQNLTYRSADDVNLLNAFNEDGLFAAISVLKKSGIYGGYADYSICVEDYIRSTSNVGDKNLYRGNSSNIETIIFRKP